MTALLDRPRSTDAADARTRRRLAAPLLVGMLGLAVSLAGITVPSIWYDEAATITSATRDWDRLWAMTGNVDAVHAAYYAIIHVVFDIVGYSPLSLRAPSAVAIGVAAALVVVFGRLFDRPRLGVLAGIVFCLLPRTIWAGAEGRSYALTATLAILMTVLLVLAIRSPSRWRWALYALAVVASVVVFVYLALVVMAHAVTLLWWLLASRRDALPAIARWTGWTTVAMVAVVPFALLVVGQSGQVSWIDPPGDGVRRQIFQTQWFMFDRWHAVVGWLFILAGVTVLIRRSRGLSLGAFVIPGLVVPTVALLAMSVAYIPVYTPRYLTMCLPFVALAIGVAIDALRPRLLGVVAVVLLAALAVPQSIELREPEAKDNSTWAEVAGLVARDRAALGSPTTAIVYGTVKRHATTSARVIAYAYPDAFDDTIDVTLDVPAAQTDQLWETRIPLEEGLPRLADAEVVYLITAITRDRRPATTEALGAVGWRVTEEWNLTWMNVLRYERG
jgi:mannosyltransferase